MIYTVTLNPAIDLTLTVPDLELNKVLRATHVSQDLGGKGFNVSRATQLLGGDSKVLGFIGGASGKKLEDGLMALSLSVDFIHIAEETRTNIVLTEATTTKHIKVNEPGPVISTVEQNELLEKINNFAQPGDLWALSGSLPPGIPVNYYAKLIKIIQDKGAKACLDTSGEAFTQGLMARPFLVKPNKEETQYALGIVLNSKESFKEAINRFHALGVTWVAISCGPDGLYLSHNGSIMHAPAPSIRVANTVGAGDALLAGILWAFSQGKSQMEMAAWGVATGSAAAQLAGVAFAPFPKVMKIAEEVLKSIVIL